MRINKYLSMCGLGSRRKCEQLILSGEIAVNGMPVDNLATDIKDSDAVTHNGNLITPVTSLVYVLLNKPKGYVTTLSDDKGRKTVMDLISVPVRVFPVGRLDYNTEGLLLLTNDGALTEKLTHPRNEITKTYVVKVRGQLNPQEIATIKKGVTVEGVKYAGATIKDITVDGAYSRFNLTVREGKNHEIKNIFVHFGHEVVFLKRVEIGGLRLGGLERGKWRYLSADEVAYLKNL